MHGHYPFSKAALPCSYISLNPYLDPDTIFLHHQKVYRQDVDYLNEHLAPYPQYQGFNLEQLIFGKLNLPTVEANTIKHFAGSLYCHQLYFDALHPAPNDPPISPLGTQLAATYGTFDQFKSLFVQAAVSLLGTGWVWLVCEGDGRLHIVISYNYELPKIDSLYPLLACDIWEHAYYLRYPTELELYVENWFKVVDWTQAEKRYAAFLREKKAQAAPPASAEGAAV